MLTVWQAAFLGILQGLTEFLPVSSSGHLVIAQEIFGLRPPDAIAFDVLLHLGTLVAVVVYFRADLVAMALALAGRGGADAPVRRRWVGLLALGTLPVVVVGFVFKARFDQLFVSPLWAGAGLLLTGTMLAWMHGRGLRGREAPDVAARDALLIGAAQSVALFPGVSRSGSTLFGGLVAGLERTTAARFAFLLSIPAILGAVVLNSDEVLGMATGGRMLPLAVGFLASAATGLMAIEILMRAVRRGSLRAFSVYCWTVGALTLAWSLAGTLPA